ncbi:VOC family protein [Myxococcus hansupus]|uniref:VOC family protein n=1 Tax=Pseudomyxococcus hansupus TaxID=1297742 RepID=UPI0002729D08|nr:VOC family protein [Myxococcus hansupus]
MAYKPEGYTSVAPYLVVDGAGRTVDFLVEVFGAERLRMVPGDNGRLMHGEVRIDDTVIMLSEAANGWPAVASHVHLYVADVDGIYQRALAAGAEAVKTPVNSGDGDKRGGFRDAGGTTWWVATQESN